MSIELILILGGLLLVVLIYLKYKLFNELKQLDEVQKSIVILAEKRREKEQTLKVSESEFNDAYKKYINMRSNNSKPGSGQSH